MGICLGNLSIKDIEERLGIILSETEKEAFNGAQMLASLQGENDWHCFDIPLFISCGSMEKAIKIRDALKVHEKEMKTTIQIGIDDQWKKK